MNYDIIPFVGTASFRLGMDSKEIMCVLGDPSRDYQNFSGERSLDYDFVEFTFDEADKCVEITFLSSVVSPCNASLNGTPILGEPYQAVKRYLETLDGDLKSPFSDLLISLDLGIGVAAPDAPEGIVTSLTVSPKGRYEACLERLQ